MRKEHILTYCHIGKVGGKQLQFYLRSHFGYRYRGVAHAINRYYEPQDLQRELKINPHIRYLGGHDVRPSVDFGAYDNKLQWFSFFRNPYERLISHYYQQRSKPVFKNLSLEEWINKNPNRAYWNIYMLAGENNLQKAIDLINTKFAFVGLTAHYEESLFLLAHKFELNGFQFNDQKSKKAPENIEVLERITANADTNKAAINEILTDEHILYQHVCNLYNQQVNAYGRPQLDNDLNSYLSTAKKVSKANLNNLTALAMDHIIWRPTSFVRKSIQRKKIRN